MVEMFDIEGSTVAITVGATAGRAIASECTAIINAMRGKLDNKKRWNLAILDAEWAANILSQIRPGGAVTLAARVYRIEEEDFITDSGTTTFFMS